MKKETSHYWNYRIIRRRNEHPIEDLVPEFYYEIHEVYYKKNKIDLWTATSMTPYGESREDLIRGLQMMLHDAKKYPVLEEQKNKHGKDILVEVLEG